MAGKQSAGTERAVSEYRKGMDVYALARRCGVSPSNLYRALKSKGYNFKKANGK